MLTGAVTQLCPLFRTSRRAVSNGGRRSLALLRRKGGIVGSTSGPGVRRLMGAAIWGWWYVLVQLVAWIQRRRQFLVRSVFARTTVSVIDVGGVLKCRIATTRTVPVVPKGPDIAMGLTPVATGVKEPKVGNVPTEELFIT